MLVYLYSTFHDTHRFKAASYVNNHRFGIQKLDPSSHYDWKGQEKLICDCFGGVGGGWGLIFYMKQTQISINIYCITVFKQ